MTGRRSHRPSPPERRAPRWQATDRHAPILFRPVCEHRGTNRSILVPLDGQPQADRAFQFALEHFADDRVYLIHVIDLSESSELAGATRGFRYSGPEVLDRVVEAGRSMLDPYVERADAAGVNVEELSETGRAGDAILESTDMHDLDHVVMGRTGRTSAKRVLLGSVVENVIRRSSVPVMVVR